MSIEIENIENLQEGLLRLPLGEVIEPTRPRIKPGERPELPFIGMEHVEAHTMKLLGTVPAGTMKSSAVFFQPDDVLYGRLRPYLNKVYRPDFEGLCSAEFIVFPHSKHVNSRYLQYFLNSWEFVSFATHLNEGDRPRVDFKQLATYPFPLPSLAQQVRIVAEIEKQFSRLDEAVANLKRVKTNLKRYKAAVLKASVEGKLTEEWRRQHPDVEPADKLLERILTERRKTAGKGKYKEPVAPDTSGLPELPEGWVWASTEQLARHIVDGTHYTPTYVKKGIDFISAKDIDGWKVDFSNCRKIPLNEHLKLIKRCHPQQGHILVTKSGTIGRVAIVSTEKPFSLFESVAVIPLIKPISSEFVGYSVYSAIQGEFGRKSQKGVAVRHLHLEDLRQLPVPLPPLTEQNQIVAEVERRLSIVAEAEVEVDNNLRRADRLRQSILKQAFSGQLVPQDLNDEPASVLLERIKDDVGANLCVRPPSVRRPKSGRHTGLPLQKTQSPTEHSPAAPVGFASLDAVLAAILDRMQPGHEYSRADLADPLGLSTGRWNAAIQELKRRGQVRQVGEKRGARYILL